MRAKSLVAGLIVVVVSTIVVRACLAGAMPAPLCFLPGTPHYCVSGPGYKDCDSQCEKITFGVTLEYYVCVKPDDAYWYRELPTVDETLEGYKEDYRDPPDYCWIQLKCGGCTASTPCHAIGNPIGTGPLVADHGANPESPRCQ